MAASLRIAGRSSYVFCSSSFKQSKDTQSRRNIKVGSRLPDVTLYRDTPSNPVRVREVFQGKKGVLFSVLGAFTPGCTQNHIPEYLEHYDKFQSEGYEVIACVAVNDPFVMSAWGKAVGVNDKILMLADMKGEFTKAVGMDLDCTNIMGNVRSKRYSVIIDDGVIQGFNGEPDHTGLACLLCIRNVRSSSGVS